MGTVSRAEASSGPTASKKPGGGGELHPQHPTVELEAAPGSCRAAARCRCRSVPLRTALLGPAAAAAAFSTPPGERPPRRPPEISAARSWPRSTAAHTAVHSRTDFPPRVLLGQKTQGWDGGWGRAPEAPVVRPAMSITVQSITVMVGAAPAAPPPPPPQQCRPGTEHRAATHGFSASHGGGMKGFDKGTQ